MSPDCADDEPAWFALYVQVNHEKEVVKRLEEKAITSLLPLTECWSKRRDRRKKITVPIFPGYVFVNTVLDSYTHVHVLRTPGAVSIIRNSEGPLSIPEYQIDSLKRLMFLNEAISIHPYLKEGDWVQVVRGPLTGCTGILLRQDHKKGRLVVSIDIVRQAVSVELNSEDLKPLARPPKVA